MLGESYLTYLVDHNRLFSTWFETQGPMDLIIYTLSAIQLPLNIFLIVVLLLYPRNKNVHLNSSFFITNLAFTDIFSFIMTIISVFIQQNIWSHQRNYNEFDPVVFSSSMRSGCRWQIGLFTFSYLNTVLATGFLTLDRYLFIYKPLKYSNTVTNERIKILILISWIFPVFSGLLTFLTTNVDQVKMCIPTHTSSRWPTLVTALLVFMTIVAVFILYILILLSYWGLKRRLSVMIKKNTGQEEDQLRNQNITKKLQKIVKFLQSSKYVIIVITTFTICWLPWILNVFYDIMLHGLGIFQDSIEYNCGILTDRNNHSDVFSFVEFEGQSCVHGIMRGYYHECDVTGKKEDVCVLIHEHMHDYLYICISRLCICFSMLSSLINPCVHGLWFPGFRQAFQYLCSR